MSAEARTNERRSAHAAEPTAQARPEPVGRGPRTVADVMTRSVVAVSRDTPFKEIVRAVRRWQVSALPVLAGDGRVVGVVSEADLLSNEEDRDRRPILGEDRRVLRARLKADARTAGELMTTPAITVRYDAGLPLAARTMAVYRVKRLPVTDAGGHLEGIVSRSDLLRVYLRDDSEIAEEIRTEVVEPLFHGQDITVLVREGVARLGGAVPDTSLIPLAMRLVRAVEGVIGVENKLYGRPRRPDLD